MNSKLLHKNISRHDGCTVTGALTVTTFLRDSATIVHGPKGCCHQASSVLHSSMLYNECFDIPDIFSSAMDEKNIIFGGEDSLNDAIKEALDEDFMCIFVIGTCISDTIGDDIESVCSKFKSRSEIPIIPVRASGFLGGSFDKGFISALKSASKLIKTPDLKNIKSGQNSEKSPKIIWDDKTPSVNIIGEKNLEFEAENNFLEVKRLLKLLGADVNVRFIRNTTTSDIKKFCDASLCVIRDDASGEIKEYFEGITGLPCISSYPCGVCGALDFLKEAGHHLGINPDDAVNLEIAHQKEVFSSFEDLRGEKISFDSFGFQKAESSLFKDIADLTGIIPDPDGAVIPVPFYTPVGTAGVKQMLLQWRRFINE